MQRIRMTTNEAWVAISTIGIFFASLIVAGIVALVKLGSEQRVQGNKIETLASSVSEVKTDMKSMMNVVSEIKGALQSQGFVKKESI